MEEPEFNKQYHVWRDGEYLETAIWRDDPNNGPCFLRKVEFSGIETNLVIIADRWEEVGENKN